MMLLQAKGVPYQVMKVDEQPEARAFLIAQGHKSVPQVYKDGELFVQGGYKGLLTITDSDFTALKES
jgi:glutaredoxin